MIPIYTDVYQELKFPIEYICSFGMPLEQTVNNYGNYINWLDFVK